MRAGWGGRMSDRNAAMDASANLNICLSVAANSAFLSGDTIRPFSVSPSGRFSLDFYESETDTRPFLQGVSRTLTTANDFGRNFPTAMVNGLDDAGEGCWILTISVDQYAATTALWFGINRSDVNLVFPNLKRFATVNLGFMAYSYLPCRAVRAACVDCAK